jgi:multidrug efflux pump subunit AcrA (membrane-fusion protein)
MFRSLNLKLQFSRWIESVKPHYRACGVALCALAALAATGCGHGHHEGEVKSVAEPPSIRVTKPQKRTIVREVGQPSFIEAYERTAIFPKVTGYIEKWYVDIGDKVTKGQVLADLFVPEIAEDYETKGATVELDKQKVELAKKVVLVAKADVKAAEAQLAAAKAILEQYQSQVDRWDSEVKRLAREADRGIVDKQIYEESINQLRASSAARDAAKADILKAEAQLLSKQAVEQQDEVAVDVDEADLEVATSDWKRMAAWVGYLKLYSPYDGIITARNANTGDIVIPLSGDPSADQHAPHLAPGNRASPIYMVDRTDIVRIFVDIPERDANYVRIGTKANVLARAFRDEPVPGEVTRTSWALNVKSRTLRAEIDLPNVNAEMLPGMYAYGKVIIERDDVYAIPTDAITYIGDKKYYWKYNNGKVQRTEVQTGVSDGKWIEITNHQAIASKEGPENWVPVNGSEQVALGDLSSLVDGGEVKIAEEEHKPEVAKETPHPKPRNRVATR